MTATERNLRVLADYLESHSTVALAFGDTAFVRGLIVLAAANIPIPERDIIRVSQIRAACAGNRAARAA